MVLKRRRESLDCPPPCAVESKSDDDPPDYIKTVLADMRRRLPTQTGARQRKKVLTRRQTSKSKTDGQPALPKRVSILSKHPGTIMSDVESGNASSSNDQAERSGSHGRKGKRVHYCDFPGCDRANRPFSRAEHLRRHQLNHGPTHPYVCDEVGCHRGFYRKDLLLKHREKQKHQRERVAREAELEEAPQPPPATMYRQHHHRQPSFTPVTAPHRPPISEGYSYSTPSQTSSYTMYPGMTPRSMQMMEQHTAAMTYAPANFHPQSAYLAPGPYHVTYAQYSTTHPAYSQDGEYETETYVPDPDYAGPAPTSRAER